MEHMAEEYFRRIGYFRELTSEEEKANREKNQAKNEKYTNDLFGSGNTSDRIFANIKNLQHEEYQYLNIIENIIENGVWEEGRNGKTKSIFGNSMRFSLKDGKIPILTTKKTAWKTCLKELLWFVRGETDNNILKEQGVHIWDANGSREFLDSRGLTDYEVDELGPIYGRQWRNFNGTYITQKNEKNLKKASDMLSVSQPDEPSICEKLKQTRKKGVDQLQQIIDSLKDPKQRTSRRLIMTAWNPEQLDQMALPPCHILCQFNVHNGNQLSCALYQRSCDVALGKSFNIASYSFLTHLLAKHCGLEAHEFVYFIGNEHLYEDHIEPMKEILNREPFEFPTVSIKQNRENIDDYQVEDFEIHNYKSHEAIKMKMVA
jgi:thymidylate synthase